MIMTTQQRGKLIGEIVTSLSFAAKELKRPFDEGDLFLSLAFKCDEELEHIAKKAGL